MMLLLANFTMHVVDDETYNRSRPVTNSTQHTHTRTRIAKTEDVAVWLRINLIVALSVERRLVASSRFEYSVSATRHRDARCIISRRWPDFLHTNTISSESLIRWYGCALRLGNTLKFSLASCKYLRRRRLQQRRRRFAVCCRFVSTFSAIRFAKQTQIRIYVAAA